ncbi:MAG: hypothetical protein AAF664_23965 [Planctomycetota bacterium]
MLKHFVLSMLTAVAVFGLPQSCFSETNSSIGWLRLTNNDRVRGQLLESSQDSDSRFLWKSDGFQRPFLIDPSNVKSLIFDRSQTEKTPEKNHLRLIQQNDGQRTMGLGNGDGGGLGRSDAAESAFFIDPLMMKGPLFKLTQSKSLQKNEDVHLVTLRKGQRILGSVVEFDGENLLVKSLAAGLLKIRLREVLTIKKSPRLSANPASFGSLSFQNLDLGSWTSVGNRLSTDVTSSSLHLSNRIPPDASVEFEIGWQDEPNFKIGFGVDENEPSKPVANSYWITVWNRQLILFHETDEKAFVGSLGKVADNETNLSLTIDLRRSSGEIAVRISSSTKSNSYSFVMPSFDKSESNLDRVFHRGIWFENVRGNLTFDSIAIMPLTARDQDSDGEDSSEIVLESKQQLVGKLVSIESGKWTLESEGDSKELEQDEIIFARFSHARNDGRSEDFEPNSTIAGSLCRVLTTDGELFLGVWDGVDGDAIVFCKLVYRSLLKWD